MVIGKGRAHPIPITSKNSQGFSERSPDDSLKILAISDQPTKNSKHANTAISTAIFNMSRFFGMGVSNALIFSPASEKFHFFIFRA